MTTGTPHDAQSPGEGPGESPGGDRSGGRPTLARSLGLFAHHVWSAIRTPTDDAGHHRSADRRTVEVGRRTDIERRDTPRGPVTVRRTVIEEVDVPGDEVSGGATPGNGPTERSGEHPNADDRSPA